MAYNNIEGPISAQAASVDALLAFFGKNLIPISLTLFVGILLWAVVVSARATIKSNAEYRNEHGVDHWNDEPNW